MNQILKYALIGVAIAILIVILLWLFVGWTWGNQIMHMIDSAINGQITEPPIDIHYG